MEERFGTQKEYSKGFCNMKDTREKAYACIFHRGGGRGVFLSSLLDIQVSIFNTNMCVFKALFCKTSKFLATSIEEPPVNL